MDWWQLGDEPWTRGDWLSLGQLVFTALGFGLAIWQLWRAANAAEGTNQKLARLYGRILGNDVLVNLPVLHRMEDDIDTALKAGDPNAVQRALAAYVRTASENVGILESQSDPKETDLITMLTESIDAVQDARSRLSKSRSADMAAVVWKAMSKVNLATAEASKVVALTQRKVEEDA